MGNGILQLYLLELYLNLVTGSRSLVSVSVAHTLSESLSGLVSLSATAAALLEVWMRTVRTARSNAATSTTKTKNTKKNKAQRKAIDQVAD